MAVSDPREAPAQDEPRRAAGSGDATSAARSEAWTAARAAVMDAALRGLCREGREAVALDVLAGYGIHDLAGAARLAVEEGP